MNMQHAASNRTQKNLNFAIKTCRSTIGRRKVLLTIARCEVQRCKHFDKSEALQCAHALHHNVAASAHTVHEVEQITAVAPFGSSSAIIMMLGVLLTGLFVAVIVPLNVASSPAVPKRTVVITGANRGIGLEACKILAASNEWSIIMACRSRDNALEALKSIPPGDRDNIEIEDLDLADLASIKSFAERLSNSGRCINVLACNAGIQLSSSAGGKDGSQVQRTKNGFEATVGTNHLGHFYLLNLMLKTLKKQKRSRIVIMGSGVHNPEEPGGNVGSKATLGDMRGLASGFTGTVEMVDGGEYNADKAYKDSKLV